MNSKGRVLLGGVGLFLLACAGKRLNEVGELNHAGAGGDSAAHAGQDSGGTTPAAGAGAEHQGGDGPIVGGTGPLGGTGGVIDLPEGGTGAVGGEEPDVGHGTVFEQGISAVTAVTADDTTLYWVEHGTEDSLGNYQHDGRLLARDFDDTEVRVLADELPGPTGVALTTEHVFVTMDQHYDGGGIESALARVPLAGGSAEVVMVGPGPYSGGGGVCPDCFVHRGDTLYFPFRDDVYQIASGDSVPTLFAPMIGYGLTAGEDQLYVQSDGAVWAIDYDTAIADMVRSDHRYTPLHADGEFLYGIDSADSSLYLARSPVTGGPWVRLPPKQVGDYSWRLQVVDGLFFYDVHNDGGWQLIQGNASAPSEAGAALTLRAANPYRIWIGTPHGIFWNDGDRLMRVPLVTE